MAIAEYRNHRALVWILGAALLGVWGEVGYKILLDGNSGSEDRSQIRNKPPAERSSRESPFIFDENVRDPFAYRVLGRHHEPSPVKPSLTLWVPPPLRFEGVLIKRGMRTVIVESSDGKISFASSGDTINGVNVLAVDEHEVKYRYEKKDTSWLVSR